MDNRDNAGGETVILRPEGRYAIWQDDALPRLDERQFNPGGYQRAEPIIGKGGRGSAWFVEIAGMPAVLKHYRRGGWAAKLGADRYWDPRDSASRSFQEMNLLHYLHDEALPVPRPLAAFRLGRFGFYQAAILTGRIIGARSLVEAVLAHDAPWAETGSVLARFHALAVRHADLNANNILIDADDAVHVIDWDKGRVDLRQTGWPEAVLARLIRSLHKELGGRRNGYLEAGIEVMTREYRRKMP
jgi:3-deoxy-D-manno-octulosonic acid kinase